MGFFSEFYFYLEIPSEWTGQIRPAYTVCHYMSNYHLIFTLFNRATSVTHIGPNLTFSWVVYKDCWRRPKTKTIRIQTCLQRFDVAVKLVQVKACCSLTSSVSPSTSVLALC